MSELKRNLLWLHVEKSTVTPRRKIKISSFITVFGMIVFIYALFITMVFHS